MPGPLPSVVNRVLGFLRGMPGVRFQDLALDVFRFQYERNAPYRRLCDRTGRTPDSVRGWDEVPFVPTEAFRGGRLSCAEPVVVFRTSGTTGDGERGEHPLPSLDLYEASWEPAFRRFVLPDRERIRIVSLVPLAPELPHSSLAWMCDRILERCGAPGSRTCFSRAGLCMDSLVEALEEAETAGEPVLVLGTMLALAEAVRALEERDRTFSLPPGSRVMDTGGSKGLSRAVTREELLEAYRRRLGIPAGYVVGEYGMTELCSQFYERTLVRELGLEEGTPRRVFAGPPWVRTLVLDAETLEPLPEGRPGLLAHFDLANAWTVSAVLTSDLGIREADGFVLLGRAPGARPRGCSLATEAILDGAGREP